MAMTIEQSHEIKRQLVLLKLAQVIRSWAFPIVALAAVFAAVASRFSLNLGPYAFTGVSVLLFIIYEASAWVLRRRRGYLDDTIDLLEAQDDPIAQQSAFDLRARLNRLTIDGPVPAANVARPTSRAIKGAGGI
jgi:hypothetical protein